MLSITVITSTLPIFAVLEVNSISPSKFSRYAATCVLLYAPAPTVDRMFTPLAKLYCAALMLPARRAGGGNHGIGSQIPTWHHSQSYYRLYPTSEFYLTELNPRTTWLPAASLGTAPSDLRCLRWPNNANSDSPRGEF